MAINIIINGAIVDGKIAISSVLNMTKALLSAEIAHTRLDSYFGLREGQKSVLITHAPDMKTLYGIGAATATQKNPFSATDEQKGGGAMRDGRRLLQQSWRLKWLTCKSSLVYVHVQQTHFLRTRRLSENSSLLMCLRKPDHSRASLCSSLWRN